MQHIGKFSAALNVVVVAKGMVGQWNILRVQSSNNNNNGANKHVPDKRQSVVFNSARKFQLPAKFAGKVVLEFEFKHAFLM